jgi:hypothetical protein
MLYVGATSMIVKKKNPPSLKTYINIQPDNSKQFPYMVQWK